MAERDAVELSFDEFTSSIPRQISYTAYWQGGWHLTYNAYDRRGNRLYDDESGTSIDRRDYTYDARNNLITVEGDIAEGGQARARTRMR